MTPLLDAAVRFVAATLIDGLWEAALLALAACVALCALRGANATTRHTVLAIAFVASLVLPIVTACIGMRISVHTASDSGVSIQKPIRVLLETSKPSPRLGPVNPARPATTTISSNAGGVPRFYVALPRIVAFAFAATWLAGVLFFLVRLALSFLHLERLKRTALPVRVEFRDALRRWADAPKGVRQVRLCRSSDIAVPIAVGLFDAMILLPDRLIEELAPADIASIALHELAHLRRADDWMNAIERIAQAFLFFNPSILWLIAHLGLEREVACDDWVLAQNDPLPYATCLAKIVEAAAWPHRPLTAPGAFVTRRAMSVRIERLLTKRRNVGIRFAPGPTSVVLVALLSLCAGAATIAPSFGYTAARERTAAPLHHAQKLRYDGIEPRAQHVAAPPQTQRISLPRPHDVAVIDAAQAANRVTHPAVRESATAVRASAPERALPVVTPMETVAVVTTPPDEMAGKTVATNAPDYIDELASAGYSGLNVDELIELRATHVTAEYIRELDANGFHHPSIDELVRLSVMRVVPAEAGQLRQRFPQATIDDIATSKALGVTPAYIDAMSAAGLSSLTLAEAVRLQALHIDPDFMRRVEAHGFHNMTPNQLMMLKLSGVLP